MAMFFFNDSNTKHSDGSFRSRFWFSRKDIIEELNANDLSLAGDLSTNQKENDEFLLSSDHLRMGIPVWVHLSSRKIEFYIERYNSKHPVNTEMSEILYEIPLDDPQEVQQALLNPQFRSGRLLTSLGNNGYLLYHTDQLPDKTILEVAGDPEAHTLHELLLIFFYELNYSHGAFISQYPEITNEVREKLSQCELYHLIRNKFRLYYALQNFNESNRGYRESVRLRNAFNIYLNAVLSGSIQNEFPGELMKKGQWFSLPEEELEQLAAVNKTYKIEPHRIEHIQNALLQRHAVASSMKIITPRYKIPIVLQAASGLIYALVFSLWIFGYYKHTDILLLSGLFAFLASLSAHASQQHIKISLYLPRILVAVASGWFIFLTSEELMHNPMTIEYQLVGPVFLFGITILFTFLFAEVRQFSPYFVNKNRIKLVYKSFLILIYTFNVTVTIGLFVQPIVLERNIKGSQIMLENVYSFQFDSLLLVEKNIEKYREKLLSFQAANASSIIFLRDDELLNVSNPFNSQLLFVSPLSNFKSGANTLAINNLVNSYNLRVESLNSDLKALIFSKLFTPKVSESMMVESITKYTTVDYNTFKLKTSLIFLENDRKISTAESLCGKVLRDINEFRRINDNTELLHINTYIEGEEPAKKDNTSSKSKIQNKISKKYTKGREIRYGSTLFGLFKDERKIYLFPAMLIFETIMVMLIAIIGSLIISEKTVTEAL
jgi:hypothetical protein